ncbi:MAG TPA: sugar ABC transporter ATP-binding protein [Tepidisphaeraceae bacterium]|nr:sugar ABC transporter ATP-binding protein [Tepidisphaeraceae bacterium]
MSNLLKLSDVTKSFAGVRALRGVCFGLSGGEVHALIGENGAGKSTLIRVVTGAHLADSGTLQIAGQTIIRNSPVISRSLGVAVIYQQPALFGDLTVAENIAIALEPRTAWRAIRWNKRRAMARELLARVGSDISPDAEVRQLSMPQQQLVEIAKALGADARIFIMDEPTASLSDREVEHLFGVIKSLRQRDAGIVYISHRLEEIERIADRVTVLRDGTRVATHPMSEINRAEMIRLMVGRESSAIFPKTQVKPGAAVLELQNVCCNSTGVHGIDLSVRAGEIVGLAGLVGAGRTELARVLFGLTPADTGRIKIQGRTVQIRSPRQAIDLGIACLPEDRRKHGVILEMPVAQNITLSSLPRVSMRGWLSFRRERLIAHALVDRLGVKTASLSSATGTLSGGNQQKVALARWLAIEPKLVILDEPTQGVDVGAKSEIHRLMGELAQRGIAILMISSELPEILGMCDRIAVMHGGTITSVLDREKATQEKILDLALGLSGRKEAVPA